MCRNFMSGPTWMPGIVLEVDDTSVLVRQEDGRVWGRHMDHVTSCNLPNSNSAPRQQAQLELPTERRPIDDTCTGYNFIENARNRTVE